MLAKSNVYIHHIEPMQVRQSRYISHRELRLLVQAHTTFTGTTTRNGQNNLALLIIYPNVVITKVKKLYKIALRNRQNIVYALSEMVKIHETIIGHMTRMEVNLTAISVYNIASYLRI